MSTILASGISDEDILSRLKEMLHQTFEIEPTRVQPDAHLFTDLELDSIDAVDLAIQARRFQERAHGRRRSRDRTDPAPPMTRQPA